MTSLAGFTVLDFSEGVAGPYAAHLLAGWGARVIKVEAPGGDPARAAGPFPGGKPNAEASALFLHLNAGKESVALDLSHEDGRRAARDLMRAADLVIESAQPGYWESLGLGYDDNRRENRALTWCSVTPFGLSGPRAGRPATDLTLFAASGQAWETGEPDRPPLTVGGAIPRYLAGIHVFGACLAGLFAASKTGEGDFVEVSMQECLAAMTQTALSRASYDRFNTFRLGRRGNAIWAAYPCKDGYAVVAALPTHFARIAAAAGDSALFAEFLSGNRSPEASARLGERLDKFFALRTRAETVAYGMETECPFGYVATVAHLLESAQLAERNFFGALKHPVAGTLKYAGPPWVSTAATWKSGPAPLLGQHTSGVLTAAQARIPAEQTGAARGDPRPLPLSGVRVLDMTRMYAGPFATGILADLGADIIKVESSSFPDYTRWVSESAGEVRGYNHSLFFHFINRNKRVLSLDIGSEEGRQLFLRLAARCDVVIENARTGVVEELGVGYEDLRAVKPDIIMVSMPGFGRTGPERELVSYATVIEGMSGHMSLTGYEDDATPCKSGTNYADPVGGTGAATAVIAGLIHHQRTGEGQFIDLAQRDLLATMIGEAFLGYQMNGELPPHYGNRHPSMAPHGIYPCLAGEGSPEAWVAIAVRDDDDWKALRTAMGNPEWAAGSRFDTLAGRLANQDELDADLSAWTAMAANTEIAGRCAAAGVPAAEVVDALTLVDDPHMNVRGAKWVVKHPDLDRRFEVFALPWRYRQRALSLRRIAPDFAQDNEEILGEVLGMTSTEVAALVDRGVLGRDPQIGPRW